MVILLTNSLFVFAIPSGLGLYYFVSGLFVALEQFVVNLGEVQKMCCNGITGNIQYRKAFFWKMIGVRKKLETCMGQK